jgi:FMN-dependent NADH-azoreductase
MLTAKKEELENMVANIQRQLAESYKNKSSQENIQKVEVVETKKPEFEQFLLDRITELENENSELKKVIENDTHKIPIVKSKTDPEVVINM